MRSLEDAEKNPKSVDNWIDSISDLHRQKPPQNVHYNKTMPDIESLMQEWPPEFEEMLKTVSTLLLYLPFLKALEQPAFIAVVPGDLN